MDRYKTLAQRTPYRLARSLSQGRVPLKEFKEACMSAMLYGRADIFAPCLLQTLERTFNSQKVEAIVTALVTHPTSKVESELRRIASARSEKAQRKILELLEAVNKDEDLSDLEDYPQQGFEC